MVGLASAQATRPRPDLNRIKMVLSENVLKKPRILGKTFSILLHTSNGHRFGVTPFKSAILGDLRSIATGGRAKKVPLRIAHQQRFGTFVHLQCAQGLVLSWDGGYPEMVCLSQGKGHSNIEKNWMYPQLMFFSSDLIFKLRNPAWKGNPKAIRLTGLRTKVTSTC